VSHHIVVVEDDLEFLGAVCAALRNEGFMVTGIGASHKEICSLLHPPSVVTLHPPDVYVIDLDLEQGTALQIVRLLRRGGPAAARFVGTSGRSSRLREAVKSNMFHSLLAKPFDLDELITCSSL
jgi:DNA-binding response OmpR family regulator